MKATAVWLSENRFEVETPDGSFFIGPKPEGPSDPASVDYLTASLAGCVGYFVAKFLGRKGFDLKDLKVSVVGSMAENPHRIGAFDITVDLPAGLPPDLMDIAKRAAESCTVHHTLQHPPKMTFTYRSGA